MALQGTLDTFEMPDVLRLLDSTKKTGCLRLDAGSSSGAIHVADGSLVAAASSRVSPDADLVDVMFDLLRLSSGSFAFDPDAQAPDSTVDPMAVESVLADAEAMLAEWHEIEKVVPSLDCWVKLAADLPGPEVVVSSARWRTIAAVGAGTTVRRVGETLSLGEVAVCRQVKDLVEADLVEIDGEDAAPSSEAPSVPFEVRLPDAIIDDAPEADGVELPTETLVEPSPAGDRLSESGLSADDSFLADVFPGLTGRGGEAETAEADAAAPVTDAELDALADEPAPEVVTDLTDDDMARQLANLSPKAAAAVQAAAEAPTEEAREVALEQADQDDETINRGLLLKFLGSVNN